MFFNILSALTLKKSTAGTTQRTGRKAKPAQPPATPIKKASAFRRVLKALKCSRSKTKDDLYDPFSYPDPTSPSVATSTPPGSKFTDDDAVSLPPLPSTITTPTTVYSEQLAPINDSAGKHDSKAEARKLALERLVAASAGHQETQTLQLPKADRLWDTEEAGATAKKRKEKAKRRAHRSDLQVKSDCMLSHDRVVQDVSYKKTFSLEPAATPNSTKVRVSRLYFTL
ncbi:hypothetical protein FRC04_001251 [Tulasnella sp. 424]|nr:hypothetical protein FRC04_001251 [Tulasnella sp. 424]KAG8970498.1 hypothetical protein FRC05_000606 [Tulasnella sp. 425]